MYLRLAELGLEKERILYTRVGIPMYDLNLLIHNPSEYTSNANLMRNPEVIDIPESEILIEAIRRNSRHGKQLSWVEKRHYAVLLYRERDMDVTQIAEVLSVSEQWIRDLLLEPITETDL